MINIFIFLLQIIILFFFYRVYFNFIIEYINLFFISEIKNFFFDKFNLKINFAMQNNINNYDLQKPHNLNDLYKIEDNYNNKDKILITIGFIVTFVCIYIFFKNVISYNDISISSNTNKLIINQDLQNTTNLIINSNNEFITDNYSDILPIFLDEALEIDNQLVKLLKANTLDWSSIHVCLKIDILYSFQNNLGLDTENATEQTEKLFTQYIDVIDKFIINKSIFLKKNNV